MKSICRWTMPVALLAMSGLGTTARADTVIKFDDLPDLTVVTDQYAAQGVVFTEALILRAGDALDTCHYPPYSDSGVLGSDREGNAIEAIAVGSTWLSVGAYVTGASATYLEAYDSKGKLLGSAGTPGENVDNWSAAVAPPNIFLEVVASDIAYAKIFDLGGYFTIDNFTFATSGNANGDADGNNVIAVPLPAAAWAGMALLGGLAAARKVRHARQ